ncbi:uncharacterized protein K444DRAFT_31567 [Hyaloscypha bicolor E]|uniref:Uncharacterized protein n=1 Tax=Hyaloscypha bicolor E TaxID=1095630 RepID=A0A2J6T3M2_9HELO|nr:uncharacterized protein K444DRAFT_31567 [Hyaloscypha bicolor E]PMD57638.1 hypothetical protein K444DRAFT_31567 [Hyaloscypha bicolor E]
MAKDSREDASGAILDDAIQQARCVETMARFLRMPHEKFFKLLDYIFDNMEKEKKAVAWELEPNYDEAVIHKNERVVVPEKDVAHGGTLSGVVQVTAIFDGHHSLATGVVICNQYGQIVITAAHPLYSKKWGYAKRVIISAGVGSISSTVESRDGIYAVVPYP